LENLLRMTAVQAESMRGLGGYMGGMYVIPSLRPSFNYSGLWKRRILGAHDWGVMMVDGGRDRAAEDMGLMCCNRFMAASKVLGEETVRGGAGANAAGSMEERSGGREGSQGA
jgi:hypothetical protein